jgi:hypothetical protein
MFWTGFLFIAFQRRVESGEGPADPFQYKPLERKLKNNCSWYVQIHCTGSVFTRIRIWMMLLFDKDPDITFYLNVRVTRMFRTLGIYNISIFVVVTKLVKSIYAVLPLLRFRIQHNYVRMSVCVPVPVSLCPCPSILSLSLSVHLCPFSCPCQYLSLFLFLSIYVSIPVPVRICPCPCLCPSVSFSLFLSVLV